MKYNNAFAGEDFHEYVEYLETVRDKFPNTLFDFVSDSQRHNLEEKSLHDSWVDEIKVNESRERDAAKRWQTEVHITIVLLGPYHDRNFELKFKNVRYYEFGMRSKSHTDLITYEIYPENLHDEDYLVFNAEFADDSMILIKAENIEITEILFEPKA